MSIKTVLSAIALAAAVSIAAAAKDVAVTTEPPYDYQGWGLAISYDVIGEVCPGALPPQDVQLVKQFIADGLADAKVNDKVFDHDRFVRDFRADMVAKYSRAGSCTPSAIDEARKAIGAIRTRGTAVR